ncbi:MAG: GNAT family N-acetyltransferase [Deltaproteobacteria bacterium]|nr:GNAT family N-acetyltransferase [Deltaproteobacteria bacterium]
MEAHVYPIEIPLRDGRTVVVRQMVPGDAKPMLEFFRGLPEIDRRYLRNDVTQPRTVERYVTNEDDDWLVGIAVEHENRIIGTATLERERHRWATHVADVRFVVARDWQGQGIATALAGILVRHAMSIGLEKIVAHVVDGQAGAERALERLGFVREAVLRRHVQDITGRKRDLHVLTNDASHIWERMEHMVADYQPIREH